MSAPVLSDVESFVYATEKLHNIESNKLWNYRKRPRSGLRLRVSFEPERVRESAICYITHWLWLAFDHSIESDSKLQRFFIFFRFSNNSFHFSTFHWLVRSPCLVSPWPAGRFKLIYAFLSSISRKMTHTHTHTATVSVSFWSRMFPTLCCPKCIKWYQYFRHTNRMKLLNISFWWLFYAKTMSIMILWPDWIEKRIKSSDQHTRTQKHMESLPRLKNDAFGQRLPSIRSIFDTVGRDFGRKYARIM